MATLKQLQATAKELNEVIPLDPPIDVKSKDIDLLTDMLHQAIDIIDPDVDEFTDATNKVLAELGYTGGTKAEDDEDSDDDDQEDEDEVEEEKPAKSTKETKPAVKNATAPEKKNGIVTEKKKEPSSYFVRLWTCENPSISTEEINKKLEKKGLAANKISINIRRMEMLAALAIMKELAKIK